MAKLIVGSVLAGTLLGFLDCLVQFLQGVLTSPSSFWRWSFVLFLVPLVLASLAAARPRAKTVISSALLTPSGFMVTSMALQNVANGIALDTVFLRYAIELSALYTVICAPFGALAGGLSWFFRRPRIRPGHCSRCSYDLTGNVSGRCPECGTPVANPADGSRTS